ncbi:hypothetical protein IWQ57_000404 [Coemansia nantahalensis]|uniref:Uncharacterized protein n=1 Tax=Coemansia nantahalensis TaxID=2789366 RepID=A0ACC1K8N1_9FUNG|nr:hypothetical protein IWQ57_000404 [Coemansia nantahalensis]
MAITALALSTSALFVHSAMALAIGGVAPTATRTGAAGAPNFESVEAVVTLTTFDSSTMEPLPPLPPATGPEATGRQLSVWCEKRDCDTDRDWLTRRPTAIPGWVLGGVAAAVALALAVVAGGWGNAVFADGVLALAMLSASLFLRGALGAGRGDSAAEHKAAMALGYVAGIQLTFVLGVLANRLHLHLNPLVLTKRAVAEAVGRVFAVCLAALVAAGAAVMFDSRIAFAGTGLRLIQAALVAVLAACLGIGALAATTRSCAGAEYYRKHYAVLASGLVLVALWAAFALARTLLPLDNPARDHPAALYVLGYAPLMLVGCVFVVLKAPLYFNFDLAAQWQSRL